MCVIMNVECKSSARNKHGRQYKESVGVWREGCFGIGRGVLAEGKELGEHKQALNSKHVSAFFLQWVVSCDLVPNEDADANVVPKASDSWTAQAEKVQEEVDEHMLDGKKLDAVMCVAGGWAGGNAASAGRPPPPPTVLMMIQVCIPVINYDLDLVKNCDLMWKQSVWTSVVAAGIAARHLREGGLLVLTGAKAALEGTPGEDD